MAAVSSRPMSIDVTKFCVRTGPTVFTVLWYALYIPIKKIIPRTVIVFARARRLVYFYASVIRVKVSRARLEGNEEV